MTVEERAAKVQRKVEQYDHQRLLQENRNKEAESKIELRRKILIGEMFIKHFPIALKFTPGKSSDENSRIFKPLDDYMELLAECQQSFQKMEEALIQLH
ncbi:MAG: hypothetical protein HDR04_05405 [Lachnospiraceae bacterium]|nr:hypothetical protein [Lachnospiraceae bacterium]